MSETIHRKSWYVAVLNEIIVRYLPWENCSCRHSCCESCICFSIFDVENLSGKTSRICGLGSQMESWNTLYALIILEQCTYGRLGNGGIYCEHKHGHSLFLCVFVGSSAKQMQTLWSVDHVLIELCNVCINHVQSGVYVCIFCSYIFMKISQRVNEWFVYNFKCCVLNLH